MANQETIARIDELNAQAWEMRNGDPVAAAGLAESARALAAEGERYERGEGRSLLTLGSCAIGRGEFETARLLLLEALELLVRSSDRAAEADGLGALGYVHTTICDYPEALKLYDACLAINRELGNREGEAHALTGIGGTAFSMGSYQQALESFARSVEICREIADRVGEARGLGNIGIVHYELGDHQRALEHHHAGLAISAETGNRGNEANQHCNIGNVYASLGDFPRAVQHYHAALRINQETGNRLLEASILGNLGTIHCRLGEYPQALERHMASVELNRGTGNRKGEAIGLREIGSVHLAMDDPSRASEFYSAGLAISREIGDRFGEAGALIGVASAATSPAALASALEHLAAAAAIAEEIGARALLARTTLNIGYTHAMLDRPAAAVEILELALAQAVELEERDIEVQACEVLSQEFEKLGDPQRALEYLRRHLQLQKEIAGDETRQTVHNLESTLQIEIARREAEIERLRTVELKEAFDRLEEAHTTLKSTQSQLVQSEKMASLGQLTAGIAHEINNPINFVSASLGPLLRNHKHLDRVLNDLLARLSEEERGTILRDEDVEETVYETERLIASIKRGADRTAEIVAGLRSFSRLDEGGLKSVDLHEGLDAALTILSGSLGGRIAIVREYGELPPVECFPGEINQAFMNILANAIKAIDGVGTITIRTEVANDAVQIAIADSGVGMAPDVRARIFEPFFTTRDVGEGRGLGLSIAWGIVEKHGGSIAVESTIGEGSRFIISLPVLAAEPSQTAGRP